MAQFRHGFPWSGLLGTFIVMIGMSPGCLLAQPLPDGPEASVVESAPGNSTVVMAEIMDGNTSAAVGINGGEDADRAEYVENNSWSDFEVHFLVSLPFTALYSYLMVTSLDAIVQGTFPTPFRSANTWTIIGFAFGSSVAVALGSMNRVPDQSQYRLDQESDLPPCEAVEYREAFCGKMELLRVEY